MFKRDDMDTLFGFNLDNAAYNFASCVSREFCTDLN